jgi:hypothetical protein
MRSTLNSGKITEVSDPKFSQLEARNNQKHRYFVVTSECVIAWTDRAMRFCTPTLRMSLAT